MASDGKHLIGNKYGLGNKGGGRKSAYHEHQLANKLIDCFTNDVDFNDLQAKFESGVISLFDLSILKAYSKDNVLLNLINKVLPDKVQLPDEDEVERKIQQLTSIQEKFMRDAEKQGEKFKQKQDEHKKPKDN